MTARHPSLGGAKRVVDFVVVVALLLILLPVMVAIAVAVTITSPGGSCTDAR